jgi:hypothetical protein
MTRMIWLLAACSLLMLGVACSGSSSDKPPQFDFSFEAIPDAGDGGGFDADLGEPKEAGVDKAVPDKGVPDKGAPDKGAPDTGAPDSSKAG